MNGLTVGRENEVDRGACGYAQLCYHNARAAFRTRSACARCRYAKRHVTWLSISRIAHEKALTFYIIISRDERARELDNPAHVILSRCTVTRVDVNTRQSFSLS